MKIEPIPTGGWSVVIPTIAGGELRIALEDEGVSAEIVTARGQRVTGTFADAEEIATGRIAAD